MLDLRKNVETCSSASEVQSIEFQLQFEMNVIKKTICESINSSMELKKQMAALKKQLKTTKKIENKKLETKKLNHLMQICDDIHTNVTMVHGHLLQWHSSFSNDEDHGSIKLQVYENNFELCMIELDKTMHLVSKLTIDINQELKSIKTRTKENHRRSVSRLLSHEETLRTQSDEIEHLKNVEKSTKRIQCLWNEFYVLVDKQQDKIAEISKKVERTKNYTRHGSEAVKNTMKLLNIKRHLEQKGSSSVSTNFEVIANIETQAQQTEHTNFTPETPPQWRETSRTAEERKKCGCRCC